MTEQLPFETTPAVRKGPSPALIIFLVIPLIGLGIALGVLIADQNVRSATGTSDENGVALAPTAPAMPSLDYPASDFTAQTLDGGSVTLSDYRGRVVFLNFWGTWCPPCVRELPALEQFASEQGEDGAVVLASNDTENADIINTFFADEGITLNNVRVLLDSDSKVYRRFVIPVMPTTYIIDKTGMVRYVKYGEMTLDTMYSFLDDLAQSEEEPADG